MSSPTLSEGGRSLGFLQAVNQCEKILEIWIFRIFLHNTEFHSHIIVTSENQVVMGLNFLKNSLVDCLYFFTWKQVTITIYITLLVVMFRYSAANRGNAYHVLEQHHSCLRVWSAQIPSNTWNVVQTANFAYSPQLSDLQAHYNVSEWITHEQHLSIYNSVDTSSTMEDASTRTLKEKAIHLRDTWRHCWSSLNEYAIS